MWRLTLRPGRETAILRRHPWLFSGAVARRDGDPADGKAEVMAADGRPLARGFASPGATLEARLWSFGDEPFDQALIRSRFVEARAHRAAVIPPNTTGFRLLHSEGDRVPGLVADRYGSVDVLVLTAEGAFAMEPEIAAIYREVFQPGELRLRRGLETSGRDPDLVSFSERGLSFVADLAAGQKTGFFLDQRENRARIRGLAADSEVLNLFSYSGGFSVSALAGGARRAVDVDSSETALVLARRNRQANGQSSTSEDFVRADVFEDLRRRVAAQERWNVVIADPPAFARKRADVDRAARGYKDIFRLSMGLVAPGGTLLACSCSGHISSDLFQKILFAAASDAGVEMSIFEKAGAGPDHPVSLDCPETEYLKAFFLRRAR